MAKPPLLTWDSSLTNLSAVTGGHQTSGVVTNEIFSSAEWNGLFNNVFLWFAYLLNNIATIKRNHFPTILGTATGWAYVVTGTLVSPAMVNTSTGTMTYDLNVPQGYKLSTVKFALVADVVSPGGPLSVSLLQAGTQTGAGSPPPISIYQVANGSFPVAATDQTINFLATSTTNAGGQTVTVVNLGGGAATFTRSAGSYIADGLFVGQKVQWTGFVNGGNNIAITITALTATVLSVTGGAVGSVNETGAANATVATGVSPTVDDTFGLQLAFAGTASAHTVYTGMLRYTVVPQ